MRHHNKISVYLLIILVSSGLHFHAFFVFIYLQSHSMKYIFSLIGNGNKYLGLLRGLQFQIPSPLPSFLSFSFFFLQLQFVVLFSLLSDLNNCVGFSCSSCTTNGWTSYFIIYASIRLIRYRLLMRGKV